MSEAVLTEEELAPEKVKKYTPPVINGQHLIVEDCRIALHFGEDIRTAMERLEEDLLRYMEDLALDIYRDGYNKGRSAAQEVQDDDQTDNATHLPD